MANKLRSQRNDIVFGICGDFQSNKLPTNSDVLKQFLYHRKKNNRCEQRYGFAKETAEAIINMWLITKIPMINEKSVIRKIEQLYDSYLLLLKSKNKSNFATAAKNFVQQNNVKLFDISICKCIENCKCSYEYKVPINQREFLNDQRSTRQMILLSHNRNANGSQTSVSQCSSTNHSPKQKRKKDEITSLVRNKTQPISVNITNRIDLNNVVRERQRYNISTRATASILNAFMKDIGVVSEQNIIDRNKIIRESRKQNSLSQQSHKQNVEDALNQSKCFGLFFDGKKDKTNKIKKQ